VDEVAVWNRTMNASEINEIYQNGIVPVQIIAQNNTIPLPNAEKVYTIPLSYFSIESADSVSIAPIVKIGNKEHVCNAVPEVIIPEC